MPADDEDEFVADLIEDLASYNGPYKLDVPPEYLK